MLRSDKELLFNFKSVDVNLSKIEEINYDLQNKKILIITSQSFIARGVINRLCKNLDANNIKIFNEVKANPDIEDIEKLIKKYKHFKPQCVIGLGGGSVMDTAKAISIFLDDSNNLNINNYFRTKNMNQINCKLDLICIPTTSGTGSEVTPFATIWDKKNSVKYSLSGNIVYPTLSILDPTLTTTLNKTNTLLPALDTISHCLESLWNIGLVPETKKYAYRALQLTNLALPQLLRKNNSLENRENMQLASTFGGIAISKTKTAIAHALSYKFTNDFDIPHGLACSFTLIPLIEMQKSNIASNFFEENILKDTSNLLKTIDPLNLISKEISTNDIVSTLGEVANPERLKNYSGNAEFAIKEISKYVSSKL